jgi:hypothetical protein
VKANVSDQSCCLVQVEECQEAVMTIDEQLSSMDVTALQDRMILAQQELSKANAGLCDARAQTLLQELHMQDDKKRQNELKMQLHAESVRSQSF